MLNILKEFFFGLVGFGLDNIGLILHLSTSEKNVYVCVCVLRPREAQQLFISLNFFHFCFRCFFLA